MSRRIAAEITERLWRGASPYTGFPHRRFRPDVQGWNSHHPFLGDTITHLRPTVVVEVGVWKGASTIHMAKRMRDLELNAAVIAIDTWLGSWEHWEQEQWFPDLMCQFGYPTLYYTFLTNVIEASASDYIIPLPLDSGNASVVLQRHSIQPQIVHIDGGHDRAAITADLDRWWPLLTLGGVLIVDDYDPDGNVWPAVRDAVDDFCSRTPHESFESLPYKCRLTKPLQDLHKRDLSMTTVAGSHG